REGTYGLQIDRFSLLVIYTALRSLVVGGQQLWNKYENGDNLLFTREDFERPRISPLFHDLVKLEDAEVRKLAQALAIASQKPVEQTPLLADLVGPGATNTPPSSEDTYVIGP
ncbi:MAG: hypothetical protein JNM56_07710, partial [Planctomycetia bacterium]|nr:hypothetical protein [Planctomycetia bacterium]